MTTLFCKHEYSVIKQYTESYHDSEDIHTCLVSCHKCGNTKYIKSNSIFKYVVLGCVMVSLYGIYLLVGQYL